MEEMLMDSESLLYRYLRPSAVQRIFRQHQSGQNDYHKIFSAWLFSRNGSGFSHPPI